MARWMLLYRDGDSNGKALIVNDTNNNQLPFDNAESICEEHGEDFNDGGGVFVIELPDEGEPSVFDGNDEVGRQFVDL